MNKDYTHIAIVLDRSGSMSGAWPDVVGGYENIVKENKALPGKCTFTVAAFDDKYDLIEDFVDIQNVKEKLTIVPRGFTALLDAIGKTIVSVGEKLAALAENERPEKVVVMVQTDGYENMSREFTAAAVKKMIEDQTEKYKWEFIFLGATLDSVESAKSFGFKAGNVSTYSCDNYDATLGTLSSKMSMMRSASSQEEFTRCATFTEEEKVKINKP